MERNNEWVVLLRFDPGVDSSRVRAVLRKLGKSGPGDRGCRWHAPEFVCVSLRNAEGPRAAREARTMPGVSRAEAVLASRGLILGRSRGAARVVGLGDGKVRVGGNVPVVIAGPCSVESAAQICEAAAMVREAGAAALRGGAFKPRTSPYSFAGLGERGLEFLALAREKTGLPIVTEALDPRDVDIVARYADVIQIGSRNMHNSPLLFDAGNHPSGKPVLLKRGFGATIDEFLNAAEHVLLGRWCAGHSGGGLILCERGIRTFADSTRFTLDLAAISLLRSASSLPVIADPSHSAGISRLVPGLARAAIAAQADGLLVEAHPSPSRAYSDGKQALDSREFRRLMRDLNMHHKGTKA